MSLAATLALPDALLVLAGVTLELAPPTTRLSLRGRNVEALGRAAGLVLPGRIGDIQDGVAKLGPDEWLALLNPPPAGEVARAARRRGAIGISPLRQPYGLPPPPEGEDLAAFSVVDVSSRSIGITITGPNATALISAGCPLDLARMAPGRATRTLFETVEIILIRTGDDSFYIDVWRSFAPWLFAALAAASPSCAI